jgi:hypothetical protein
MKIREDSGRVLLVGTTFFGGLALAALATGVFTQLSLAETAAVLAFVVFFGAATYALDRDLRRYVAERLRKAPARSPAASPAAPSSARTSARGWDATRGQPGD